jgi:hypothetical protein
MRLRPAGRLDQEARQNHRRSHRLPTPLVWIEHWPKEAMDGEEESFELVVFSSYEVV